MDQPSPDSPVAGRSPAPGENPSSRQPLLQVEDLKTHFHLAEALARAVDGVSFSIDRGRTLGMVGESGCGKSVTALSILQLVPSPPGRIESGRILFEGRDLLKLREAQMRRIRGNRIGMVFQEPMTSLNPLFTVGDQVAEVLRIHRSASRREAAREAVGMLERVGVPSAATRARDYPHQLSGGLRQRAMIAMALACGPSLLIADEPTTALDLTIQAQILALMETLQQSTGTAILLITHDLGVVAQTAHDVVVMYAGNIVESAPVEEIFRRPAHPYTEGLMRSIPRISAIRTGARLTPIEGTVPDSTDWPAGCRFHPRCPHARPECRGSLPPLSVYRPGHNTRCLFSREIFGE